MGIKNGFAGTVVAGALALGMPAAQAAVVCMGCEYGDQAATNLGSYNPDTFDFGTFQHSDVGLDVGPSTAFEDFWVFDLDPAGSGSVSADFTLLTGIAGFIGELYMDGGSDCAGSDCSNVVLGGLIDSSASTNRRWEIIAMTLPAGRYILRVAGTTNARSTSVYGGQLAFIPELIPEPGAVALFGLGVLGMGMLLRRNRAHSNGTVWRLPSVSLRRVSVRSP
jgi:PEP-CTERM motif